MHGRAQRQTTSKMRAAKLNWMRQALKRIGHGVVGAVDEGRCVFGLRSQNGSTMAQSVSPWVSTVKPDQGTQSAMAPDRNRVSTDIYFSSRRNLMQIHTFFWFVKLTQYI